ncbi:type II toxin-antitoxin system RelE/ParE family toxin, partial [Erysipelothrix aquatica]|uniref:type II toxin-antitoxin system RelE/ParE family toxin n=1 Tax=Erysipelothrix aquatica TaxID=2683714 RepID=UPI00202CDC82
FYTELSKRNKILFAKVIRTLETVEGDGLEYVDTKHVDGEIYEMRIRHANDSYRVLFKYDEKARDVIVVSHGFAKKTQRTPEKEKQKARRRFE